MRCSFIWIFRCHEFTVAVRTAQLISFNSPNEQERARAECVALRYGGSFGCNQSRNVTTATTRTNGKIKMAFGSHGSQQYVAKSHFIRWKFSFCRSVGHTLSRSLAIARSRGHSTDTQPHTIPVNNAPRAHTFYPQSFAVQIQTFLKMLFKIRVRSFGLCGNFIFD